MVPEQEVLAKNGLVSPSAVTTVEAGRMALLTHVILVHLKKFPSGSSCSRY